MSDDAAEAPGALIIGDMIARATASCVRIRAELAETPRTRPVILQRRQRQLRIMEGTLARLMAEREGRRK